MNRINEIHIEGVGTVRHLTNEDHNRIRHAARGPNRDIMQYAFSCGMSLRRFKALPVELQREVVQAFQHLCSSENIKPVERPKVDRPIFQPRIHRTDAEWSEIGYFSSRRKDRSHGANLGLGCAIRQDCPLRLHRRLCG